MRRSFQQVVSIIIQLNSNKQSWSSEAAVQKSLHSTLKKFAKFKWQHLHWSLSINSLPIRYCIKNRLRVFLWILQDVYEPYFSRNPPDNCFCIFHSSFFYWFLPLTELMETRFSLFLNMFYHSFRRWWISWILHLENTSL